MVDLTTQYAGLKLKNPLIVGSSGLTETVEGIQQLEKNGAGAVVLKSLFEEEIIAEMDANLQRMASESFIYPETLEFYEHDDTHEELSSKYLDLIRSAKRAVQIPVIASINCVSANEWTYFPKQIQQAGADALELNVFVLPSDFSRSAQENEQIYFDIVKEVKKQVSIPVSLKISYYFSNLGATIQKLSQSGIESLVLFNRFYSPDFDLDKLEVVSSNVLSSPSDLSISLRWVAIMSQRVQCDLAASTGVHSGKGLIKQLLAGANAVQVVSSIYKHGFAQIGHILAEAEAWMIESGYESIDQFRGKMSQAQSSNPAAYERVQFMKYFRGYKQEL